MTATIFFKSSTLAIVECEGLDCFSATRVEVRTATVHDRVRRQCLLRECERTIAEKAALFSLPVLDVLTEGA